MVGGGWVVDGGSLAPRDGRVSSPRLFPASYNVLKNQPTNCFPRTRCTAVRTAVLLYDVVKVWSVGGWRVHCVVRGGWVGRSARGSLFSSCGRLTFFFCFYNTGLPLVLGSTTVPTAALHGPLLPYVLLHCRTAQLLFCYFSTSY